MAFAAATVLASGAGAASSSVTVSFDVASSLTLTNSCRSSDATAFGAVQPDTPVTTSTTAPCSISFTSSNDSAMLRLGIRDGVAPAMAAPGTSWNVGANSSGRTALGLAAYDANRGAVVAMGGRILRTADAGSTWTASDDATFTHWGFDLEFVPSDPERLVVVGGGATVRSTANAMSSLPGAATWANHDAALDAALTAAGVSADRDVTGVAVKDALTWVLGGYQFMAYTTDGGASFTAYATSPTSLLVTDVDWVGAGEYLATGSDGRLYRATAAPTSWASWTAHTPGDLQYLTDLAVANATNAYFTTRGGLVFHWNGSTISSISSTDMRSHRLFGVATSSTNPGYATVVGNHGRTWRTQDAGTTWTEQDAGTSATLHAAAMPTSTSTWAAGSTYTVVRSTDSGATWTRPYAETLRPLSGIAAHPVDGRIAVAVGEAGTHRRTADGGATWSAAASMGAADLLDVTFATATTAWAVGKAGAIHRSADGGITWSPATSPASPTLVSVDAADDLHGWAVGDGGTILRTTNGGTSWTAQPSGTTSDLHVVVAFNRLTAVAVGNFGTLRRTTDGGATWSTPTSPPSGTYSWIAGATTGDGQTMLICDFFGNVRRSTDAGDTWTTTPNADNDVASMDAAGDGRTVVVSGWFSGFAITTDAGSSWEDSGTGMGWGGAAVANVDAHTSFIAHDGGRIIDTDEAAAASLRITDYGTGATFGSGSTTSTFGVCVQAATGTLQAGWTVDPGGSCSATDTDPWRGVPTTATNLVSTTAGATGSVQLVWGARPRVDQPPGRYSASVVFEAVAPAA